MGSDLDLDAVVIGAGFGGLYLLHRLREAGLTAHLYEAGADVGGVWYWNRYPGARCDIESIYYCYTFSEALYRSWTWRSRYPDQREILTYLGFVADSLDLRPGMSFGRDVRRAEYDAAAHRWRITFADGEVVSARYLVAATGTLSVPNMPDIPGIAEFAGAIYHTGKWPHHEVSFAGKRVGLIGTGSSGIQCVPEIAKQAAQLTVFQRTPQYSLPARNRDYTDDFIQATKESFSTIAKAMRDSVAGYPTPGALNRSALSDPEDVRTARYEKAWQEGLNASALFSLYSDLTSDRDANDTIARFCRAKIAEIVVNPKTAAALTPHYPIGGRRVPKDCGYFETFNRDNVALVDVKRDPIVALTSNGLVTEEREFPLDMLVFATGYDAMTGPLTKFDVLGTDGRSMADKWSEDRVTSLLGIAHAGFPNFFTLSGPLGPGAAIAVPVLNEYVTDWIVNCIEFVEDNGFSTIEASPDDEQRWADIVDKIADATFISEVDSWYNGANGTGKRRGALLFFGGFQAYRAACEDAKVNSYQAFRLT